jgi:hypothetical protein
MNGVVWVRCRYGMACPHVKSVRKGLQVQKVAGNLLNKQSRAADKLLYY